MVPAASPRFEQRTLSTQPGPLKGLRKGLPVYCIDSRRPVGKLDGWLDNPEHGTDLLVGSAWLNRTVRRVPGTDVDTIGPDRVLLSIDRWQFQARPLYVPDEELEQAVYDALRAVGPIRYLALRRVEVRAAHGVVRLSGHVPKELHRREAVEIAAAVPGVVRVEDQLVSDERLTSAVALAMQPFPELQPSRVTVHANLGAVILEGELDSPRDVELAKTVAAGVPGVVSVDTRLRVRGAEPGAIPVPAWPSGGGDSRLVALVPAQWPPWRQAGELVVDRNKLADIVGREVIK